MNSRLLQSHRPRGRGGTAPDDLVERVQAVLVAARARDERADLLDAVADRQEREIDLARMLSPAPHHEYGADWPARRRAALDRARARDDRLRAREDLLAVLALCGGRVEDCA